MHVFVLVSARRAFDRTEAAKRLGGDSELTSVRS
jgi:hypothetical protein